MLKPPANLPIAELSRLFWQQRVKKYERERDAWIGSPKQRALITAYVATILFVWTIPIVPEKPNAFTHADSENSPPHANAEPNEAKKQTRGYTNQRYPTRQ